MDDSDDPFKLSWCQRLVGGTHEEALLTLKRLMVDEVKIFREANSMSQADLDWRLMVGPETDFLGCAEWEADPKLITFEIFQGCLILNLDNSLKVRFRGKVLEDKIIGFFEENPNGLEMIIDEMLAENPPTLITLPAEEGVEETSFGQEPSTVDICPVMHALVYVLKKLDRELNLVVF